MTYTLVTTLASGLMAIRCACALYCRVYLDRTDEWCGLIAWTALFTWGAILL